MRFIQLSGFYVKRDKQTAFQEWVIANEERIRKSYPAGTEYGGIYFAVYGEEKGAGDCYWLEILDSYAALDRFAAAGKDATNDYAKLGEEFLQFLDVERSAASSKILLKAVADATVIDIPTG